MPSIYPTWRAARIALAIFSTLLAIAPFAVLADIAYSLYLNKDNDPFGASASFASLVTILLAVIVVMTGLKLAMRQRDWRWLSALIGAAALIGASLVYGFIYLSGQTSEALTRLFTLLFLAAAPLTSLSALVFLAFALFGPRRETTFA